MTPDEQQRELEERISNASSVEYMVSTPGWEFVRSWLNDSLTMYDEGLKSTIFVNDHDGYLNARASWAAVRNLIDFVEATIGDGTDAKRELDDLTRPPATDTD